MGCWLSGLLADRWRNFRGSEDASLSDFYLNVDPNKTLAHVGPRGARASLSSVCICVSPSSCLRSSQL